jgi:precorrin-6Y C5,15-methyltransferase (decarboxylating)
LSERGFGASRLTTLEAMGGPRERKRTMRADAFVAEDLLDLNTIALEVEGAPFAKIIPRAPGLPDDWFEHDGQITKRAVRALTLSALAPRRGELLWDLGAGSGSVAIEWMLADPANRAVAVERRQARAERIARNAAALGVPALIVEIAEAVDAMPRLHAPDAIFIGGGGMELVAPAMAALASGGRLVMNAVTLQTQAALVEARATHGGDLMQIAISDATPVGRFDSWRPAMPVVQWRVVKS